MAMEWIDTNVQMPNECQRVLLYTPYPVFGDDYTCVGNRESITACTTDIGKTPVQIFTHWMPLPEKPQITNHVKGATP
ncbi:MAG: DUF551 domain-containing protein [Desulfuromonadaceae bacterium]|nr:DUF551 domain-containing protein [Desulfuromonadaceae bacterium]